MININTSVPDFETDAYQDNKISKIKLSNYKDKWVVLIFYPADFTFVCPTELEDAQTYYEEVKKLGANERTPHPQASRRDPKVGL